MWDVTERLRSCWLSGRAGRAHVCRTLEVLDELLYGTEDVNARMALGSGVSRCGAGALGKLFCGARQGPGWERGVHAG